MKTAVATLAVLLGAAGVASAQDERKKVEELQREFDRAMKGLQQKFDAERERLEKEFRAARERLLQPKGGDRREEPKPRSTEELLQRVLERLDHLEKRLDRELPRFDFKDAPFKNFPRDFKDMPFKDFEDWKEFAPRFRQLVPKFEDKEFRFEFKKKGEDKDDDDPKEKKKDKEKDKGKKDKDKEDDKKKY